MKRFTLVLLALGWSTVLFGLGWQVGKMPPSQVAQPAEAAPTPLPRTTTSPVQAETPPPGFQEITQLGLDEALLVEHPLARIAATNSAVQRMTVPELQSAIAALAGRTSTREVTDTVRLLWTRLGELEGLRAIEFAESLPATYLAATGWAFTDPEGVLSWLSERPAGEGMTLENMMSSALVSAVSGALAEAGRSDLLESALTRFSDPSIQRTFARQLGVALGRSDPERVSELAEQLTGTNRTFLLGGFASVMAEQDPRGAAEWALTLPPMEQRTALSSATGPWRLQAGEEEVLEWIVQQRQTPAVNSNIETLIGRLAMTKDAPGLESIVSQIPDPQMRDTAWMSATNAITSPWSAHPSATVFSWAEKIQNPQQRSMALARVYQHWHSVDPGGAAHHLATSPYLSPEEREAIPKGPPRTPPMPQGGQIRLGN